MRSAAPDPAWSHPEKGKFQGRRNRSWTCLAPARFSLLVTYPHDDISLHLSGDFHEADVAAFEDCLAAALDEQPRNLVLELSGLASSDARGIEHIRAARTRMKDSAVNLIIESPDPAILKALTRRGTKFFVR